MKLCQVFVSFILVLVSLPLGESRDNSGSSFPGTPRKLVNEFVKEATSPESTLQTTTKNIAARSPILKQMTQATASTTVNVVVGNGETGSTTLKKVLSSVASSSFRYLGWALQCYNNNIVMKR